MKRPAEGVKDMMTVYTMPFGRDVWMAILIIIPLTAIVFFITTSRVRLSYLVPTTLFKDENINIKNDEDIKSISENETNGVMVISK